MTFLKIFFTILLIVVSISLLAVFIMYRRDYVYIVMAIICWISAFGIAVVSKGEKSGKKYKPVLVLSGFLIFIAYVVPIVCVLAIPFSLFALLPPLIGWHHLNRRYRITVIVLLSLLGLRITGMGAGLAIVHSTPPPRNVYEVYKRLGPLQWACCPDVGMFEIQLIDRRNKIRSLVKNASQDSSIIHTLADNASSSGTIPSYIDIYTGSGGIRWLKKNSAIYVYSIGPDKVDNLAGIIYDPTNGSFSVGDIVAIVQNSR